MDNNLSVKILESYINIDKLNDNIINKTFQFINKASELVELSEGMYQIEKTIKLNKISLKGYLLNSPCCTFLEENNVKDYTIDELKNYLMKYEKLNNEDCSQYYLAISLFELLEEIENLFEDKIDSNDYERLYNEIKKDLKDKYLNNKLIDDKSFEICMRFVNDIFNFYINGYPNIPDEYLYKTDDL